MKIGDLNQHCGECGVIEYCGYAFGYCLCRDSRFSQIDEEEYIGIADKCKTKPFEECIKCTTQNACEDCALEEDARDFYCEQIADHVHNKITTREIGGI